jgi:CRP/FNR family cyclic AMP-dependent transcriptional regulator
MTETRSPEQMLSDVDLFSGLSGRQVKKLAARAKQVDHEAGREVAAEGLGGLAFHLILSGQATVSTHGQEVRRLNAGEYFGEITMIDGKPRSATVTVAEPMRTLVISSGDFQELLKEEPDFARGLLVLLCARLREAESRG